jgi:hypothetical protein
MFADGLLAVEMLDEAGEAAAAASILAGEQVRSFPDDEIALAGARACLAAVECTYNYGRRYTVGPLREFSLEGGAYASAGRTASLSASVAGSLGYASGLDYQKAGEEERAMQCVLLRDIIGPLLFRPVIVDPAWLAWNERAVAKLAEAAYQQRMLPSGQLDPVRLGVLADALEEGGCNNREVLDHLRSPGPHIRGCWCVDLLLRKE